MRRPGFNKRWYRGNGLLAGTRHDVPVIADQGSQVRLRYDPVAAEAKLSSFRVLFIAVRERSLDALTGVTAVLAIALLVLAAPAVAQADFGLNDFDVTFTNEDGSIDTQAGSHPFAMTTSFTINQDTEEGPEGGMISDEVVKDVIVTQVTGLAGNPSAVPRCSTIDFLS
jgi:hypothetical protein